MKEKRVWIGLAVLFAVIGVPQLFWKPSRFGGIFLLALAIGCMGEWLMLRGREKHKACRILSRVGRVLFALFVLSFAAVQAARKARCLPLTCTECTRCTPTSAAGRPRS